MEIDCALCGWANLDHEVFYDYHGPVKCFCCGARMEIRTKQGVLDSASLSSSLPQPTTDEAIEHSLSENRFFLDFCNST